MRVSDLFPSRYVKACDVVDPQMAAIRELVVEEIGQGKDRESKPVLYFHNLDKGLVLNVTNARTIEDAFGDSENWPGKSIELFSTKVDFKGDRVDAVRVRVPREPTADELLKDVPPRPKRSQPVSDPVEDLNDEVPF